MQLSRNFSLEELIASSTAKANNIDNAPKDEAVLVELTALCQSVLQPLREFAGKPIKLNSGYRCPVLNARIGGAANSQHTKGQAADINIGNDRELGLKWCNFLQHTVRFDQLLLESDSKGNIWIHVSHRADGQNRGSVNLNYKA